MKKQIKLTTEQAQSLIGKSPEMDELIKANFPKLFEPKLPSSLEELKVISGYFVTRDADIYSTTHNIAFGMHQPLFATKSQAKAHGIVAAQLSQLMKAYNGDWVADWTDRDQQKYCISRVENKLDGQESRTYYEFITFKSVELRDEFLKNFEDLIKTYYEL